MKRGNEYGLNRLKVNLNLKVWEQNYQQQWQRNWQQELIILNSLNRLARIAESKPAKQDTMGITVPTADL